MSDALAKTVADEWLGRTLGGRYRVHRRIGEGGIGAVYLAEHLTLGRQVAVKVLHSQYAATDVLRVRFEREARALSVLSHPNIVTVLDFGREGDALFLVMERVEGESLSERLRHGPLAPRIALEVMRQVLRALAVAHARGIVHRDLKPGNVIARTLPDGSEHVVVLDFGLVKFDDDSQASGEVLTRHGSLLGTPAYMAPEQVTGGAANAPADVYAAALLFFELVTGRRVFTHRDASELLRAHMLEAPPRLGDVRPDLGASPALEAFLVRGLAKSADARFPDARAMLEAFDALPETSVFGRTSLPQPSAPAPMATSAGGKSKTPLVLQMAPIEPPPEVAAASIAYAPAAPSYGGTSNPSYGGASPTSTSGVQVVGEKKVPWVAIGAALLVLGIVAIGALYGIASLVFPEKPAESTAAPRAIASSVGAAPTTPTTSSSSARVPARNPWTDPVPSEIEGLARRIQAGGEPSRTALQPLFHYAASHDGDARAALLLGHTYAARGWLEDALQEYHRAYERDASSRGDPNMLADLVNIVHSDRFGNRASAYVAAWYGAEAAPFVDAAIRMTTDAEDRARLEHLRDRLRSGAP